MAKAQRIEVKDAVDLVMPDGVVYQVRPGPYGRGLAVEPNMGTVPRKSGMKLRPREGIGRKPRKGTVALRERLAEDVEKGKTQAPKAYVQWLRNIDKDISLAVARQVVYRERRRALDAAGTS